MNRLEYNNINQLTALHNRLVKKLEKHAELKFSNYSPVLIHKTDNTKLAILIDLEQGKVGQTIREEITPNEINNLVIHDDSENWHEI